MARARPSFLGKCKKYGWNWLKNKISTGIFHFKCIKTCLSCNLLLLGTLWWKRIINSYRIYIKFSYSYYHNWSLPLSSDTTSRFFELPSLHSLFQLRRTDGDQLVRNADVSGCFERLVTNFLLDISMFWRLCLILQNWSEASSTHLNLVVSPWLR